MLKLNNIHRNMIANPLKSYNGMLMRINLNYTKHSYNPRDISHNSNLYLSVVNNGLPTHTKIKTTILISSMTKHTTLMNLIGKVG